MKKKLVVLLAVVMMFAFSASAYAATFSDVSERSVTEQDAIAKAVALGIIEGYEDGTFGPDKTITRAEFAKIAVTAAGAKETATMLEANASSFKDVRANSWYTGWINAAESLGIFKGDQNGNFRPNDTISNQEAITVLLRLLGYNDNLTGSWPVNYVTKANQIGLLDDVNIVASAAAKRGDVVVMLGEALDTSIVTYDKDTNEFVYKQTTKSGSSYITLLADSFEGSYLEVDKFDKIDQVRDVASKTLNWSVGEVVTEKTITSSTNNNAVVEVSSENYNGNLIIDENTAVSYNSTGLFDLENHQGKVYYVKENGKLYARFIEVESYTQSVTDRPSEPANGKTKVNTTTYNATKDAFRSETDSKNSGYIMYFNDDDQVYRIVSDRDFVERSYYVKNITAASARLVGNDAENSRSKTVNMADADTLIYDNGKFIAPSDLEVGDAIMEIREGELYAKVADISGDLTRVAAVSLSNAVNPATGYQHKVTIGGKNYVYKNNSSNNALTPDFYDDELEAAGIATDDVYNNNVKLLLNKDNSVSAIIVDETSTGTTLYGIVVDAGKNSTWGSSMNSITLFTQEGYNVTYDFEKNSKDIPNTKTDAPKFMGQLVEYKLNSNGEIKTFKLVKEMAEGAGTFKAGLKAGTAGTSTAEYFEIEVKNNAYLVDENGVQRSLAANAVIFEVDVDDNGAIDPSLITRSALLSGGDFNPETVTGAVIDSDTKTEKVDAYAAFKLNTNGAIKAFAYTAAGSTDYHYGVIANYKFTDADHAGNGDYAITLMGDDKVYDLDNEDSVDAGNDRFIVYQLSGDKLTIVAAIKNKAELKPYTKYVTGFNDGLITIPNNPKDGEIGWTASDKISVSGTTVNMIHNKQNSETAKGVYNVMTDANTVVYVIDSNSGKYREGAVSDISRNAWVYVPVVDDDGYADIVLIDEYPRDNTTPSGGGSTNVTGKAKVNYFLVKYGNTTDLGTSAPDGISVTANVTETATQFTVKVNVTRDKNLYDAASVVVMYNDLPYSLTDGSVKITKAAGVDATPVVQVTAVSSK